MHYLAKASEILTGDPCLPKPADVWTWGILLYFGAFHQCPFNSDSVDKGTSAFGAVLLVTNLLLDVNPLVIEGDEIDPLVIDLLTGSLEKNSAKRLTFEKIVTSEYFSDACETDAEMLEQDVAAEAGGA
jgi:serine/threonine protein kinase